MGHSESNLPCKRSRYNRIVGEQLPPVIAEIGRSLSLVVKVNPVQANDVDLWIRKGNRLIAVAEVINWSTKSRMDALRKSAIITNLRQYECLRILIHSVPTAAIDEEFPKNSIHTIEVGFQLQPPDFYEFFKKRGQVIKRKPVCPETLDEVRRVARPQLACILQKEVRS